MQCSTREVAAYVPPHSSIGERIAARDGQKKGAVIRWLTGFAAPLLLRFLIRDRASPSFNRMSGITEFTNAVCLFVNVDSSNYSNTFYQKGRGMSHLRDPLAHSLRTLHDLVCAIAANGRIACSSAPTAFGQHSAGNGSSHV